MPPRKRHKSVRTIADEVGIPESTAERYLHRGMPADGPERAAWLADNAGKAQADADSARLQNAERAAKILLMQTKQKQAELRFQKDQGLLVERAAVTRIWRLHINDARALLETIAPAVGQELPEGEVRNRIVDVVEGIVQNALRALAAGDKSDDR